MTFPVSLRRAPALKPLALASAISLCFIAVTAPAHAAEQSMPSVSITGVRFASDPGLQPIGATVISADDIRRAGVNDVNQAIRKIGGIYGRQSLDGSPDFGLDVRGFGTNSAQNLVIVLDGVRLSENELSNAVLSSIPIDTVERIEIIRGGASVLYGDGATGGVIQIITKRPTKQSQRGSVSAEVGQFKERDLRASVAQTFNGFALDAALGKQGTDNYRDNNRFTQTNFSGGAQWAYSGGRAGVRIDSARQDSRFPGSLTLAQFNANPRQTQTPNDFGALDYDRATFFAEQRIGAFDLAADLSHREKTAKATYVFKGFPSAATYNGKQTQFSPRLRHLASFDGMLNEVVTGIDLIHWNRVTESGFSQADATQKSKAFYVRDEIKWTAAYDARLSVGARHEIFDKDSLDPAPFSAATYNTSQAQNAWEIQGSLRPLPLVETYAKAGQSYRVANADENGFSALANVPLKGQTSHDLELGASIGDSARMLTARLFRSQLNNEIYYDPTAGAFHFGANTNLDPTKRQGLEIDANARLTADWRIAAHLQHVSATFTSGPNSGKELTLVPKNIVSTRLSWVPGKNQSADLGAQWVSSQRYGDDFANTCNANMPSFTTIDARYARQFGAWELAVSGLNLTDKHYFTAAFSCKAGIYPSDGRQLKVSARFNF